MQHLAQRIMINTIIFCRALHITSINTFVKNFSCTQYHAVPFIHSRTNGDPGSPIDSSFSAVSNNNLQFDQTQLWQVPVVEIFVHCNDVFVQRNFSSVSSCYILRGLIIINCNQTMTSARTQASPQAKQHVNRFSLLWSQIFTRCVQRALVPLLPGPSEWRTWRCHLAEDPSSGSETRNSTEQCKREQQKHFR